MVNVFTKWMMTFQRKIFVFKDVLECSITYKLSEDYLSEAWKEKVVQCSKRRKDNLHERISSSSIQYHKNCYVTYN